MKGQPRALLRLLAVQGAWNYERMTGIGMGYAAEPLLKDLEEGSPVRYREATARSAEFFNCHPYLAGLALGASVRAEHDGIPGGQIQRLRTALCSPLGALGDQLFWAGLVPIVICLALVAVTLGSGGLALAAALAAYNILRVLVTRWALATGLGTGMQVGAAISASWLPKVAARIAPSAGFAAGFAVPLVVAWLLAPTAAQPALVAVGAGAVALALFRWGGSRWTSPRLGLLLAVLAFLWTRGMP